jgi:hypothetical protein
MGVPLSLIVSATNARQQDDWRALGEKILPFPGIRDQVDRVTGAEKENHRRVAVPAWYFSCGVCV